MYICICVWIYTCIRVGIYVRVYIGTHTHTHKNMRILPHICRSTLHIYSKQLKYVGWCLTAENESAGGRRPADTARSLAQPCWLGIQLRSCAVRGARCWSEIRLRRVAHTAPGTDSTPC